MSGYDYDAPRRSSRREYVREERYDDRDPRYLDATEMRGHSGRELVPRGREDSDLSIEEIRRDFPMPGHGQSYRDTRRARSVEPGWDDYDDRRSYYSRDPRDRDYDRYDRDYDRRSRKEGSVYYEEEKEKRRARTMSKQEKIIAAIAGAALAVGGKELYDRHEGKENGGEVNRNPAMSAAIGAAGALAAYQGAEFYNKNAEKEDKKSTMIAYKGRDGQMVKYYEEEEEDPKKKEGHKNFLESALAAAGLGGAVKALTGGGGDDKDKEKDRDRDGRSETRSRAGSRPRGSRSRSRSKSPEKKNKIQQAAMASLIAGATEAFRVAKEPGGWKGEKAKRVFTAAAGAATIDAAQNPDKNQKLSLAESVIGGLVGNRVIHGSKKNIEEDKATGRSRSRSRAARDSSKDGGGGSGGVTGLAALATAGLGALGAKKIMDGRKDDDEDGRSRSRSRRPRSRSSSRGGSRSQSRKGVRARSRSVVDGARRRLARIGIGNGPEDDKRSDVGSPRGSSRGDGRRRRYSDEYDDDRDRRRHSRSRSRGAGSRRYDGASDTDLGDSDDDMKETKRKRGKQILTIGLASVATIHAAHNVYQSMEKRNARHAAVKDGRLSPEEAKKLKTKALLQDAASVGIAALGVKGAISEVKEAHEKSKELQEWKHEKQLRHERRLSRLARQRAILNSEHEDDMDRDIETPRTRSRTRSMARTDDDDWALTAARRGSRDRRYEYDNGPRYSDGNPYARNPLPAPPVGYDYDDEDRRRR